MSGGGKPAPASGPRLRSRFAQEFAGVDTGQDGGGPQRGGRSGEQRNHAEQGQSTEGHDDQGTQLEQWAQTIDEQIAHPDTDGQPGHDTADGHDHRLADHETA